MGLRSKILGQGFGFKVQSEAGTSQTLTSYGNMFDPGRYIGLMPKEV